MVFLLTGFYPPRQSFPMQIPSEIGTPCKESCRVCNVISLLKRRPLNYHRDWKSSRKNIRFNTFLDIIVPSWIFRILYYTPLDFLNHAKDYNDKIPVESVGYILAHMMQITLSRGRKRRKRT